MKRQNGDGAGFLLRLYAQCGCWGASGKHKKLYRW